MGDGDHDDDGAGDDGDDGAGDHGDDGGGNDGDGDHDGFEDVVGVCSAETVGMECLHKLGLRIPRLRSAAITLCIFQTKLIINFSTLFSDADCLNPFFMAAWLLGCSVLKLLVLFDCFSFMFCPVE